MRRSLQKKERNGWLEKKERKGKKERKKNLREEERERYKKNFNKFGATMSFHLWQLIVAQKLFF